VLVLKRTNVKTVVQWEATPDKGVGLKYARTKQNILILNVRRVGWLNKPSNKKEERRGEQLRISRKTIVNVVYRPTLGVKFRIELKSCDLIV
jgi:hypothetical protein